MYAAVFSGKVRLLLALGVMFATLAGWSATAYAATCATCHAAPGQSSDIRPLDGAYRNITTGAFKGNHRTHLGPASSAADCAKCHGAAAGAYSVSHRNANIEISANINSSPVVATYSKGTTFPQASNPALGSCSNVNCHFEKITPAWGGTTFIAPTDCDKCHEAPPATVDPGSHAKHNDYYPGVSNCQKCHSDHTAEASAFAHATSGGKRDLNVSFAAAPNNGSGAYDGLRNDYLPSQNNTFGKCTATYCHSTGSRGFAPYTSNGTAIWGGTLTCKGCHKSDLASGSYINTGSHTTHVNGMTMAYNTIRCVTCHQSTSTTNMAIADTSKHVNKKVEVAFDNTSSAGNGSYNGQLAKPGLPSVKDSGTAYGSCSSIYCHSTGQGANGTWPPTYQTPVWGSYATGQCGTCHGIQTKHDATGFAYGTPAPMTSGSHSRHLAFELGTANISAERKCAACHAYTLTGYTPNACGSTICHSLMPQKHANYEINVGIPDYYGASASYSGTTRPGDGYGSCSTVYCHSDGLATPVSYAAVTWGNPASGACGTCHGVTAAAPPASVPHLKHMGAANQYRYACAECHSGKVQVTADSTIVPAFTNLTSHVDKIRNVKTDASNPFGTYSSATQSCRNMYCHSTGNISVAAGSLPAVYNGKVYARQTWSGTVSCNSCHGRSTSNGMPDYANGKMGSMSSNSHPKHVTSSALACVECHEKTTKTGTTIRTTFPSKHVDGTNHDVFFNLSGLSPGGTYDNAQRKCSTTYCHGTGASLAWGGTTYCNSCHSANAAISGGGGINNWGAGISAHTLHVEDATLLPSKYTNYSTGNLSSNTAVYRFGCASCHNPAQANHVNGYASGTYRAQVFFGFTTPGKRPAYTYTGTAGSADNGFAWSNGNTVCNTTYCHSNGTGVIGAGSNGAAVFWTTTTNSATSNTRCTKCHNYTAGSGAAIITGDHTVHISANYSFSCRKCHAATTIDGSTIADKTQHVNKQVNVAFNNTTTAVNGTYNGLASPMAKSPGSAYASCGSTYCHSKGTSAASPSAPNVTATWGSTLNTTCSGCHGNDISADFKMGTVGSTTHAKHVQTYTYGCVKCHETTVSANRTISNYASHVNRQVNIEFNNSTTAVSGTYNGSASPMTKLPGTATGTCTNTYCHSKGTSLTPSAAVPNIVPNWTTNLDATCSSCHGGDNSATSKMGTVGSAAHTKHIQTYSYGCVKCHDTTVSANRTISNYASHVNRQVNIEFNNSTTAVSGTYNGSASPMTKLPGTATGTCTNTYCHSKGTSTIPSAATPNIVPNWTTNLDATCTSCHGGDNSATSKMGTVGSATHTKHVQTYAYDCSYCHAATVTNSRTIGTAANHVNRMVDVQFGAWPNSSATYAGSTPMSKLPGSAVGACGNTYCHSNGTSVASGTIPAHTSVNWGTAGPLACNSCHGAGGTTGAPYYSHLAEWPTAQSGATWTNPANALLGHGMFASYAGTAQGTLILTNYGYTTAQVADTDTITGITVVVEGWAASGTTPGNQLNVQLTQNGSAGVGTAKTISLPGTTSAANAEVYATTTVSDLWGTTWTPAQIRATTFGVIIKDNDTTNGQLNVDMIKVIVHTSRAPKMNNHSSAIGHRVVTCNICHDSVTYSGGVYTPNVTLHVNKAYNVQASMGYTYAANGGSCATPGNGCHGPTAGRWGGTLGCVDCHSKTITRTKGRVGATLANVVGEFGLAWGHKKSGRAAVTDDDCIVCHLEGDGTSHKASAKHQDGNIDLRDPDVEGETAITNISGGAFTFQRFSTSYAAGTRTSTGQSANTIDNVITQKFCLACHDSNGAFNTKARSNNGGTGTATRPFGGIDMGANYSVVNGAAAANSMVDVKTQLATTNSSKHPVLAPLNRDFPTAARMNDPYKATGTRGTTGTLSNGVVINCFDCHNVVGTPLTLRTVTAHGNAVTVRGYPIANTSGTPFTGTSPVDANKPTLCIVCHANYDTQAPHGTGSAWSASMDAGMANVAKFGCNICHASNYATAVVRPARAQDSHGSNALPAGGMGLRAGGRWATTGKPIAFIRNTFVIDDHAPKKVGATTYSPTCMSASGTANPSFCGNQGAQGYTVGGTF